MPRVFWARCWPRRPRSPSTAPSPLDQEHRAIFRELVEINTSPDGGQVAPAARAVAARLSAAGYPPSDVEVLGPSESCQNVVATLRGRAPVATPVLLLAHLDVVAAKRADWEHDPYVLREENGWFVGRGTLDNKAGASLLVANMMRWKREGFVPARDIITVLTCDEETDATAGIQWLLAQRPRLATADYALNSDAGGVERRASGRVAFWMQAAEKAYVTFGSHGQERGRALVGAADGQRHLRAGHRARTIVGAPFPGAVQPRVAGFVRAHRVDRGRPAG